MKPLIFIVVFCSSSPAWGTTGGLTQPEDYDQLQVHTLASLNLGDDSAKRKKGSAEPVRVALLPFRSYDLGSGALEELTQYMQKQFSNDPKLTLLDYQKPLVDAGSPLWLQSDKLLVEGIEDYQNLRHSQANEKLRQAMELSLGTFREIADVHGPRRLRKMYLYLGLARLEQEELSEAKGWFRLAAQVDPDFVPHPKQYAPKARELYGQIRKSLSGTHTGDFSGEQLAQICERTQAKFLLTGSITKHPEKGIEIRLVGFDADQGVLIAETIKASSNDLPSLQAALDTKIPKFQAHATNTPWIPPHLRVSRTPLKLQFSYISLVIPNSALPLTTDIQAYQWNGTLALHGLELTLTPWRKGVWGIDTQLMVFGPRNLSGCGGIGCGESPQGKIEIAAGLGTQLTAEASWDHWRLGAGGGLMLRLLGGGFQSAHSSRTDFWAWPAPQFSVWTKRAISEHMYAHIRMGIEYDGSEFYGQDRDIITLKQIHYTSVGPWTYLGSAGIGIFF